MHPHARRGNAPPNVQHCGAARAHLVCAQEDDKVKGKKPARSVPSTAPSEAAKAAMAAAEKRDGGTTVVSKDRKEPKKGYKA